MQVQYSLLSYWEVLTIPNNMSHLEVLPTYQSLQADVNVGYRDIGLQKYNDSFRCIGQPVQNIQTNKF